MCRAIISSSLVGIDPRRGPRAPGVLMRGPPAAFAAGSSSTPSQAASRQTVRGWRRVFANAAGEHDRVQPAEGGGERAELAPNAIAIEVDRQPGAAARSEARSVRMSLEMPDTPSSPDW